MMRGHRLRDPRRRPGLDPRNLVLGAAILALYGAIIWLWVTPDDTVANLLARWLP